MGKPIWPTPTIPKRRVATMLGFSAVGRAWPPGAMVMRPCSDCHVDSPSIVPLPPSLYRRARIRFRFVGGCATGQIACLTTCAR